MNEPTLKDLADAKEARINPYTAERTCPTCGEKVTEAGTTVDAGQVQNPMSGQVPSRVVNIVAQCPKKHWVKHAPI
jgi:hypothetical protein